FHDSIVAGAAVERIGARPTGKPIDAAATGEGVVAVAAGQVGLRLDRAGDRDRVIAVLAEDQESAGDAGGRLRRAVHGDDERAGPRALGHADAIGVVGAVDDQGHGAGLERIGQQLRGAERRVDSDVLRIAQWTAGARVALIVDRDADGVGRAG